ncbi:MAG: ABC transporter permease subunit, partial [Planctomycetes bacterium]|nr:ABC transporter permease subunit [Planctomycetota bacterium]
MLATAGGTFGLDRLPELGLRSGEHLALTGASTFAAVLVGIPIGIAAFRAPRVRAPILGAISILQTIPSLAMLALLVACLLAAGEGLSTRIPAFGALPAILALTLYALLPIVRNTVAGLQNVSPLVMEAARGIGMRERQQLWWVRIPLALPVIAAGVRTAAVVGVGIATLSAFVGAGGLGVFILRGLALSRVSLILLGAVPAAILALLVDLSIGSLEWAIRPRSGAGGGRRALALALPVVLIAAAVGLCASFSARGARRDTVRIGAKNFTEQLILAEMMAHLIESRTDLDAERIDLGGTMLCHAALENGEIDVYAEYSGTGLTAILHLSPSDDPQADRARLVRAYRERFDLEWLSPFGFDNTYALCARESDARRRGWRTVSDLAADAADLRAGFTSEFMERPDGYPLLRTTYGFDFGSARDLEPSLMYRAISSGEVDVISAFATDGRIEAFGLRPLIDDKRFFPRYDAAPVIRGALLRIHPEVGEALDVL